MKRILLISLVVTLLLSGIGIYAQGIVDEDDSAFRAMLAQTPDVVGELGGEFYYYDHAAVVEAFPPAQIPADFAEFEANDGSNIPVEIYWRVIRNRGTGIADMQQAFGLAAEMPDAMGIDYFQVRQELQFGVPPSVGTTITGEFDLDAVRDAFTANDFEQQASDTELWCWVEGCDRGMVTTIADRQPANIFGGQLGRRQPLVITDDVLFSSASINLAERYIDVVNGDADSLADNPRYASAADALLGQGILIQVFALDGERVFDFSVLDIASLLGLPSSTSPEQVEQMIDQLFPENFDNYQALPQFQLLMFADVMREDTQDAVIVLVYDNEVDAQVAGEVIVDRLNDAVSLRTQRPWIDMFEDRNILTIETDVVEGVDDNWVTLINLPTARVPGEQVIAETDIITGGEPGDPDLVPPGINFRLLMSALLQRDLQWLSTVTREQLEAMRNGE